MRHYILIICFVCAAVAVASGIRRQVFPFAAQHKEESVFPIPHIPQLMTDPQDRITYILLHYWDNIDFHQRVLCDKDELLEQGFVNFLFAFRYVDQDVLPTAVFNLVKSALVTSRRVAPLMSLAYKYLYHPESPMLNEEHYRLFVEEVMRQEEVLEPSDLERLKMELASMNLNRVGEKAANFSYTLDNGRRGSLYEVKGKHTLLMFYDPECDECQRMLAALKGSGTIARSVAQKKLKLLLVCVEGSREASRAFVSCVPKTWLKAFLNRVSALDDSYVLRALPTLYLLDTSKHILLKEASLSLLEKYLR